MKYNRPTIVKSMGILFLSALLFPALGQKDVENLVPNGSFESIDKTPRRLGSIERATGWVSSTGVRADLFTPSRKNKYPEINVPLNELGTEEAKDGSSYAGFVAYSYGDKEERTYLTTKLSVPLKKGQKYCVQYYVSMAEASKYACNQIGMKLSRKPFTTEEKVSIIDDPDVLHINNKVFNAAYNWEKICGIFESKKNEKYITIGNFSSNEDTKNERNRKNREVKVSQRIAAYYYIDDISVTLIDEESSCDCGFEEDKADEFSSMIYQKAVELNDEMSDKEIIEAHTIYFGFAKKRFTQLSEDALDLIAEKLEANPNAKLQVLGHSDAEEDKVAKEESFVANMDTKRVNAVILYLMDKGIEEYRLISSPQGSTIESDAIFESDEEEIKQAKNRRVEFKVR